MNAAASNADLIEAICESGVIVTPVDFRDTSNRALLDELESRFPSDDAALVRGLRFRGRSKSTFVVSAEPWADVVVFDVSAANQLVNIDSKTDVMFVRKTQPGDSLAWPEDADAPIVVPAEGPTWRNVVALLQGRNVTMLLFLLRPFQQLGDLRTQAPKVVNPDPHIRRGGLAGMVEERSREEVEEIADRCLGTERVDL